MRHVAWLAGIAVALSGAALAQEPIAIGISIAQSPPGSVVQGTQVKDGVEIVKDMVNAKGGVLGRQIKLVYEDNQGVPEKGRAASEKLITKDKVVAITGGHQSSVCLAEIEVAHRYGVPYINTNCWSDDIRKKGYPEVFNPGNYNTRVAQAMAETITAMKLKRVIAFAENTDYGIGQAKALGEFLKQKGGVDYKYETLDRASKDFTPAVLALRANPPDMVCAMMLPPAVYILMNQLYEQGVAPSAKTWFYDGGGISDYPDFWQNVKEAGNHLISFGLYHPKMDVPALGKQVADEYKKRTGNEPNRLIFQAADSLLLIVEAIKEAKSTDPKKIEGVLRKIKFTAGVRGPFSFSEKPGYTFQQWVDIPYVNYQLTAVNQPVSQSNLIQGPGQKLDVSKLQRPK
jgi:branched-chain amino acid transport system substrate-binding protein